MVRYLAMSSPLPGVHVPVLDAERAGYGLALAVVAVAALIRWRRARTVVPPAPAAGPRRQPGAPPGGSTKAPPRPPRRRPPECR